MWFRSRRRSNDDGPKIGGARVVQTFPAVCAPSDLPASPSTFGVCGAVRASESRCPRPRASKQISKPPSSGPHSHATFWPPCSFPRAAYGVVDFWTPGWTAADLAYEASDQRPGAGPSPQPVVVVVAIDVAIVEVDRR
jgi:hypothetical protein